MIEIAIGILVFLSALFLGLSVEYLLSNRKLDMPIFLGSSRYVDIDLSGFEAPSNDESSSASHSKARRSPALSQSALRQVDMELKQEIEKLDVSKVDFDLA
jgi:hypothetical protein